MAEKGVSSLQRISPIISLASQFLFKDKPLIRKSEAFLFYLEYHFNKLLLYLQKRHQLSSKPFFQFSVKKLKLSIPILLY